MTTKEWMQAHPDRRREHQKRYYQKHLEQRREYQRNYYQKRKALKEAQHDGNLRTDQDRE